MPDLLQTILEQMNRRFDSLDAKIEGFTVKNAAQEARLNELARRCDQFVPAIVLDERQKNIDRELQAHDTDIEELKGRRVPTWLLLVGIPAAISIIGLILNHLPKG